jgi:exodeoxyribonuclease V alpha subunit
VSALPAELDPLDVRRAREAPGLLREFNDAGVLSAADVHVARRLAELSGEADELVILAAAFAVRGPRLGHVCVDLTKVRTTATVEAEEAVDLSLLAWPEPGEWLDRLRASALVAAGDDEAVRPLRLVGDLLYLDRYWREEGEVAADLETLTAEPAGGVRSDVLDDGLARLFDDDGRQRRAGAAAVLRRFAVVAGGPGTGKTTTVARIVALLAEQAAAAGAPVPLVALAAPTGKAAARLEEAVHQEAAALGDAGAISGPIRAQLLALGASTLHRLLGWRPDSHSRFRHHRGNRLPHDVVIVDETSMVSLSMMARLVEAVRPEARLILVGDPGQLTSIEAGAVLGDIVGPAPERAGAAPDAPGIGGGIVVLDRVHRFGRGIADLSEAIRRGDAGAALQALSTGSDAITWIPVDPADPEADGELDPVRTAATAAARAVIEAARAGDAHAALRALGTFRVLCAHRRGPHGVATWMARIEGWLADEIPGFGTEGPWYPGRPLLVTENDYGLRLYNGDTGVVVTTPAGRVTTAFERRGAIATYRPARLGAVDTVYAMTVHKSQGSQFDTAAVLLPPPTSHILTRELLYTAITRAKEHLILVGTDDAVRAAIERPIARASGLRWRLWGETSSGAS